MNSLKSLKLISLFVVVFSLMTFASATVSNFYPVSGEDTTGLSVYNMSTSDLGKVNSSNDVRYDSKGIWDYSSYKDYEYIEWNFNTGLSLSSNVNEAKLVFEWQRGAYVTSIGRLMVCVEDDCDVSRTWSDSSDWVEYQLHNPTANSDETETIDLSGLIDTPEQLNNLRIRFQATDSPVDNRETKHDLVKLRVDYFLDITPPVCTILSLDDEALTNPITYITDDGYYTVYGSAADTQSRLNYDTLQANRSSNDTLGIRNWAFNDVDLGTRSTLSVLWSEDFPTSLGRNDYYDEGTHTICCEIDDIAGNHFEGGCKSVCIDSQDPSVSNVEFEFCEDCDGTNQKYFNSESVSLSWDSEDFGCAGIDYYVIKVYKDGELIDTIEQDSDSLTLTSLEDGEYYVVINAVDNSGNEGSSVTSEMVIVDTTNPVVTIESPSAESWFNADFIVNETDSDANLLSCSFKILNNGETTVEWTSIECNSLLNVDISEYCPEDGTCTVYKKAKDKACNEGMTSNDYSIDRTPPVTTKEVGTPKYEGRTWMNWVLDWFITDDASLTFSCADSGVGCNTTYYKIYNSTGDLVSEGSSTSWNFEVLMDFADGVYNVTYYSLDALGNMENVQSELDKIDTEAPVTVRTISPLYVDSNQVRWINCQSAENYTCTDSEVGCDYTETERDCLDNSISVDSVCSSSSGFMTSCQRPRNCTTMNYSWRSVDLLGNWEAWKSEVNVKDCEGPVIIIHNPIGEEISVERCSMSVLIEIKDMGVGLNYSSVAGGIYYLNGTFIRSINLQNYVDNLGTFIGGKIYSDVLDLEGLEAGTYEIKVMAQDMLGNSQQVSRQITLEQGLTVEGVVSSHVGGNYTFDFQVCVRGSDTIDFYMEKINGGAVSPDMLNAKIHFGNQSADVGLMNTTDYIYLSDFLNLSECENLNGRTSFDLTMEVTPQIAAMIPSPYTIQYEVNSYDERECEEAEEEIPQEY